MSTPALVRARGPITRIISNRKAAVAQQARNFHINHNTPKYVKRASYGRTSINAAAVSRVAVRGFATSFDASKFKMFDKILIANRGEIACRIIRTCKKLGIKTVAIYSEPDKYSVHVEMADEAVCVGPAASSASYLNIDKIIEVVKQTGAQAVHPGYGFLSENRRFQEALAAIGVKFIGPGTDAIQAMGDKISSKKIAKEAGVSIIPGFLGAIDNDADLIRIANEIGYPVMIKASAGGGGKGMRIAWNNEEAVSGYRLSKQEAMASFGDDTMFVEKFIEEPRHIEIQLLADGHGNAVYLNERDCSIQRRNQKVIEEAPSTFLDATTRAQMGNQAVALAKAVGYESAGTCEFLVDKHRNFYFLEMNTRLQVEHPVTECITGLDLVEHMIRVATGEPLSFTQADVKLEGWAFESRVYAEDPLRGFLPSIGRLVRYVEPSGENIRVDSGVREASEISIHYDPMISKLITYGATRNEALQKMREALDSYVIRGLTHNINFLRSLCDHPRFISGNINTNFIPEEYPKGYQGATLTDEDRTALLASAMIVKARIAFNQSTIEDDGVNNARSDARGRWQSQIERPFIVQLDHQTVGVKIVEADASDRSLTLTMKTQLIDSVDSPLNFDNAKSNSLTVSSSYERGDFVLEALVGDVKPKKFTLQVAAARDGSPQLDIVLAGTKFPVTIYSEAQAKLVKLMPELPVIDTSRMIVSPMPGSVFSIKVQVGDKVVAGQEVAVVEAMKMQNALRVTKDGVVKAVQVKQGQTVAQDQILIELE